MSRRSLPRYYILEGREVKGVGIQAWSVWMQTAEHVVACTTLIDGSDVSTVFLGLDHQWDEGPPLLFETCIFLHEDTEPGTVSPFAPGRKLQASGVQARYSTWAEAEVGHMEIVERLTLQLEALMSKASP